MWSLIIIPKREFANDLTVSIVVLSMSIITHANELNHPYVFDCELVCQVCDHLLCW